MNPQVVIVDTRKPWMVAEDREYTCFSRCPFYRKCQSRVGFDCKRLGGNEIPKVRR